VPDFRADAGAPDNGAWLNYELPAELIAQTPAEPRDSARLLVATRAAPLSDVLFSDLPRFLRAGDLVVANDSRVMPARLVGERESGGRAELLLLRRVDGNQWECLGKPARRLAPGTRLVLGSLSAAVVERGDAGRLVVAIDGSEAEVLAKGLVPLPPYIRGWSGEPERYQTVYARELGSVAAPTAGLHFTPRLLAELDALDVQFARVTLHVGVGTFRPMSSTDASRHSVHAEWCSVPPETSTAVNDVRRAGGRVVAVGTTTVRTLEAAAEAQDTADLQPFEGWTTLFIRPGFRFRVVDLLLTNFHLPMSTLLLLVCAFAGVDRISSAYRHAIAHRYRFYSFGDAMLLERERP
jgi:S-adenosylmethionine:tRNA ribosyltransferase-isomerase